MVVVMMIMGWGDASTWTIIANMKRDKASLIHKFVVVTGPVLNSVDVQPVDYF